MPLLTLKKKEEASELIQKADLLALHFYADWVEQCAQMDGVMQEMASVQVFSSCGFARIPAEEVPEISLQYNVIAVPTVVLFRAGKAVDRIEGANPSDLRDKIKLLMVNSDSGGSAAPSLEDRLKALIGMAPVVLFMKGSPQEPRCGFSKQIVAILNQLNVDYRTFDIFQDQDVREGLKKFSDWPTYPQLYVKGELIGGLDIVKELVANGEFANIVPRKEKLEDRLKVLINSSPVMVFMKGDKTTPKCGFSRQLIQILNDLGVEYSTFDILTDDVVRQGLKEFSNWPTYPQLYIKGELVGGLDIVKELRESGELSQLLS